MHLASLLITALCASVVAAQPGYGGYGGGGGGSTSGSSGGGGGGGGGGDDTGGSSSDDASSSTSSSITTTPTATPSSASSTSSTATGGKTCTSLMCITAIVNSTTTTYQLQQSTSTKVGWMAIGFGTQMAGSPMVIMWENADGTVTISQRQAPAEVMPTVVASPPRIATLDAAQSDLTSSSPTYAFTIDTDGTSTKQNLIWAFGTTNPESSAADAILLQHADSGPIVLDVSTPIDASTGGVPTASPAVEPPLLPYQKLIVAHAIVFAFAFMLLLPTGALFARYLRTSTVYWFRGHWLIQFYFTAPVILTGFILAIVAVQRHGSGHFNDRHKQVGLVLVILYCAQCALGAIIHFVKNPNRTARPPQNYLHAIVGLTIIGLALYQVHLGFETEWPLLTGRGPVARGVKVVWIIWTILLPVLYVAGLAFLRRQFRQEAEARAARSPSDKFEMRAGGSDEA